MKALLMPLAIVLLSACQTEQVAQLPDRIPVAGPIAPLAGTSWRLVEFQSMDDAQGTRRPTNPDAYTMTLGADGRAAFQLDCNRGTGTWQATRAADGVSGSISFGPVAATRMLCPPGGMGDMLARETAHLRGWLLRDGRLALSLEADGGVYLWEPHAH